MNASGINLLHSVNAMLALGVSNRHTKRKLAVLLKQIVSRKLPIDPKSFPHLAEAVVRFYGTR